MDEPRKRSRVSRRRMIGGTAATALAAPLAGGLLHPDSARAQARWRGGKQGLDYAFPDAVPDHDIALAPTPACDAGSADATVRQTDGPFYTPDTPARSDFSSDGAGVPLVVVGRVLTTACTPVSHAVLDFWHADSEGIYDEDGHRFRGHQFADASGVFRLATIRPSGYGYGWAARPPHIHVKVQGRDTRLLTTQLYFPDADNAADRIFDDSLVMTMREENGVAVAQFDLVLRSA